MIDREVLRRLHAEENERFIALHPTSAVLAKEARANLLGGVPMAWMTRWPGSFPIFFDIAGGAHFTDVDGLDYVDFCLGDTGAMTGHGLVQVADVLRSVDRALGSLDQGRELLHVRIYCFGIEPHVRPCGDQDIVALLQIEAAPERV